MQETTAPARIARRALGNSPWVVIAVMVHVVIVAIVSVIYVHHQMAKDDTTVTTLAVAPPPAEELANFVPEVVDRNKVPQLQDAELQPNELLENFEPEEPQKGDPTDPSADSELTDLPSGGTTGGTAIGVSGPGHYGAGIPSPFGGARLGGGKYGSRFGTGKGRGGRGGRATAQAVEAGLEWLKKHQDEDGHWDTTEFMKHDEHGTPCDGAGAPGNDIGVTGLALLAFLGDGSTLRTGAYKDVVRAAVWWLRDQQDPDRGVFGTDALQHYMYSHAIATLAMCEAYGLSDYKPLKKVAQKAINYIAQARNPYGVWRYTFQGGDSDTSITGWMVQALKSAEEFGLLVDEKALEMSLVWFDQVTDPTTGRAGYTQRGEGSSRPAALVTKFPVDKTESLTAVVLLCRFFLGQDPKDTPVMNLAADTIGKVPPVWNTRDGSIDMYYWYYASFALFQMGGRHWDAWNRKMTDAIVKSQRQDGNFTGSWDPVDAWGPDGGRVYSTSTMVLCLEVYYRYARVLGGR